VGSEHKICEYNWGGRVEGGVAGMGSSLFLIPDSYPSPITPCGGEQREATHPITSSLIHPTTSLLRYPRKGKGGVIEAFR
jgi:hypothetical protein